MHFNMGHLLNYSLHHYFLFYIIFFYRHRICKRIRDEPEFQGLMHQIMSAIQMFNPADQWVNGNELVHIRQIIKNEFR